MVANRKTTQGASRVNQESGAVSRENPPPNGPSAPVILTPEELSQIIATAVQQALAARDPAHCNQQNSQEIREEPPLKDGFQDKEESQAGSKGPTQAEEELRELRGKVRRLEEQATSSRMDQSEPKGCPFSTSIVEKPLPPHFKSAKIRDYDCSTDPEEHLTRFENMAMLHCYGEEIKCKVFLTTLVNSAQKWFEMLKPQSIASFKDFKEVFLHNFSSSKRCKKTAFSLFEVKQSGEEHLRAYIRRFNRVAIEVPSCAPETKTTACTQGLKEGDFFRSLVKKIPKDFEDLLSRAEKYINMEEVRRLKRESARKERDWRWESCTRLRVLEMRGKEQEESAEVPCQPGKMELVGVSTQVTEHN